MIRHAEQNAGRGNDCQFILNTSETLSCFETDRFEHVVLLSAPLEVLLERVSRRTNNPYGKTPEQRAEIARYVDTVEPLLRRGATLELDGQRPTSELADVIEDLVTRTP